ncbi:hypothetical protein HYDPIDRAFT_30484 [Hydnomerulius pinastri MD-312]|uniref:Uncharacterized protein n=1 Tax=Hydnomerulius pinastri MD-312 TaxID=994086 RepID=A0A0C9V981_9AGAM|nr:hypothetical protein HYDPIDRAFT_30484 [Hydnomerulius pinastri MD-312]
MLGAPLSLAIGDYTSTPYAPTSQEHPNEEHTSQVDREDVKGEGDDTVMKEATISEQYVRCDATSEQLYGVVDVDALHRAPQSRQVSVIEADATNIDVSTRASASPYSPLIKRTELTSFSFRTRQPVNKTITYTDTSPFQPLSPTNTLKCDYLVYAVGAEM